VCQKKKEMKKHEEKHLRVKNQNEEVKERKEIPNNKSTRVFMSRKKI
jgi:hypothetical protein